MPRMRKDRLAKLARRLRRHKDNGRKFDMSSWFEVNQDDYRAEVTENKVDPYTGRVKQDMICGTTACALGEACTIPEFKSAGLLLAVSEHDSSFVPKYRGATGVQAGAKFFGLTTDQSEYIFMPDNYWGGTYHDITPLSVAERIEEMIA